MPRVVKSVAILGATSGIGHALARLYGRDEGVAVGATGRRAELLETLAPRCTIRAFDLTAPDALEHLDALFAEMGGLPDLVIFNAGTGHMNPALDWEPTAQTLALNVTALTRTGDWCYRRFAERGWGHFAAVGSIAGIRGLENTGAYSPSKAYLANYMEGMRRKLRGEGLAGTLFFSSLLPGFVDTAMGQASDFWRCSAEEAALSIRRALEHRRAVAYITPRWFWIALLLKLIPRPLFERIPLERQPNPSQIDPTRSGSKNIEMNRVGSSQVESDREV